jgi:hypothetical protein
MDISADQSKSNRHWPKPFLVVLQIIRVFIEGLIGFFMLTEKERLEAGIYVGNRGRAG